MKIKERKISEKQIKFIAVVIIVVIVVSVLLWGMVPGKIYDISEILDNPEEFNGLEVNVMGVVYNWEITCNNFTLIDSNDENLGINITYMGSYPEGFGNDETVLVSGIFRSESFYIESQLIQIGCPSKY